MGKKQTASHEACHALVALHEGCHLTGVSICPMPGSAPPGAAGICYTARPDGNTGLSGTPEILTAAKARVLMAGRVADELLHPNEPSGAGKDMEDLAALVDVDDETLSMHEFCRKHPVNVEAFYKRFKKPIINLLKSKQGRKAGKALSKALLEAGTLSGQAAAQIFKDAWGEPLPEKMLPVSAHVGITTGGPRTYHDVVINLRTFLFAMEHDADCLRGELSDDQENHLGKIRLYLRLLREALSESK